MHISHIAILSKSEKSYTPTTVRGWSKVTIGTSSKLKNLQPLTSSPQRSRECPVKCGYIGDKERWTSVLKLELGDPAFEFPAVAAPIRKTAEK